MNNTTVASALLFIPKTKSDYNPHESLVVIHIFLLVVLCLAAIIGNTVVIDVVFRDRRLHIPTFYFVVNLCVADILIATMYIPLYIVGIVEQRWVFPKAICQGHVFLISLGINASLITLSFISYDRFLDICFPFR